jgi:hypothetical protein
MRWKLKGEIRKLIMHREMCINAHFSVHGSFYSNFA